MPRTWPVALVVLSFGALVAAACGDDKQTVDQVYPTSSSGGGSSGTTSSGATSSSGGSSSGDVPPPDGGGDANGGAAKCADLGAEIELSVITSPPPSTGGTVLDGTYVLTDARLFNGKEAGPTGKKKAAAIVFAGNAVAWRSTTDTVGTPFPQCCEGTYSLTNATDQHWIVNCNGTVVQMEASYSVLDDAGAPQIRLTMGQAYDTYTKE